MLKIFESVDTANALFVSSIFRSVQKEKNNFTSAPTFHEWIAFFRAQYSWINKSLLFLVLSDFKLFSKIFPLLEIIFSSLVCQKNDSALFINTKFQTYTRWFYNRTRSVDLCYIIRFVHLNKLREQYLQGGNGGFPGLRIPGNTMGTPGIRCKYGGNPTNAM